jgi:hypothetical protein
VAVAAKEHEAERERHERDLQAERRAHEQAVALIERLHQSWCYRIKRIPGNRRGCRRRA